jgi:hypothetical protein
MVVGTLLVFWPSKVPTTLFRAIRLHAGRVRVGLCA